MFDAKKILIPYPQNITDSKGDILIGKLSKPYFNFENTATGEVADEAEKLFWQKISEKTAIIKGCTQADYKIELSVCANEFEGACIKDSYKIKISKTHAQIIGYDQGGLYYGVVTFLTLVHTIGSDVLIPELEIYDYPDFKTRSQFMECRFGSDFMTLEDWKSAIDYFSMLKINKLTIAVYGCWGVQYNMRSEYLYVPFKNHPNLKTPRDIKYYSVKDRKYIVRENVLPPMYEQDFFAQLVQYGKKKNMMVTLLFNSLGHNGLIPRVYPEIASVGEDGKPKLNSFCTNNPKTYEFMFGIYDELIEKYLAPYGIDEIAVGLDECCVTPELKMGANCWCDKCQGRIFTEDLIQYTINICKYLISKGMKSIYVYFDMFFLYDVNVLDSELKQRFIDEGIYDYIVIDWWNYESIEEIMFNKKLHLVNSVFRSIMKPMTGYFHWSLPGDRVENITKLAKLAKKLNMEGIEPYGCYDDSFDKNFKCSADCSWNASTADNLECFNERYIASTFPENIDGAKEIMSIMRELMCSDAVEHCFGNILCFQLEYYMHAGWNPEPTNFPGEQFSRMLDNESEYFPYLYDVLEKADKAAKWFEACVPSKIVDVWTIIAKHYRILTDTYCTFIHLYKEYNADKVEAQCVVSEMNRLYNEWESVMKYAEEVHIEANNYIYLRNMNVFREFILDMKTYFEEEILKGKKPIFDIRDMSYVKSEIYDYMR